MMKRGRLHNLAPAMGLHVSQFFSTGQQPPGVTLHLICSLQSLGATLPMWRTPPLSWLSGDMCVGGQHWPSGKPQLVARLSENPDSYYNTAS